MKNKLHLFRVAEAAHTTFRVASLESVFYVTGERVIIVNPKRFAILRPASQLARRYRAYRAHEESR